MSVLYIRQWKMPSFSTASISLYGNLLHLSVQLTMGLALVLYPGDLCHCARETSTSSPRGSGRALNHLASLAWSPGYRWSFTCTNWAEFPGRLLRRNRANLAMEGAFPRVQLPGAILIWREETQPRRGTGRRHFSMAGLEPFVTLIVATDGWMASHRIRDRRRNLLTGFWNPLHRWTLWQHAHTMTGRGTKPAVSRWPRLARFISSPGDSRITCAPS